MTSFTGYDIAFASGVALLLWIFYGAVWRLYLSPLSSFPGPKLAVLTLWYEFYYDVLKSGGGLYIWKIEELHKIYGMSARLSRLLLHVIISIDAAFSIVTLYRKAS